MDIIEKIKIILSDIDFANRYKELSEQYRFEKHFENFQIEEAKKIIRDLGYVAQYNKSEQFYKIIEKKNSFKFQFNISLKNGIVELIWATWLDGILLRGVGGPWGMIARFITDTDERIKLPVFRNYDDLREILIKAFSIYEDFKRELLKQYE
jgi:hypothetical protein